MKKFQQWGALGVLALVAAGCSGPSGRETAAAAPQAGVAAGPFPTSTGAGAVRVGTSQLARFASRPDRGSLVEYPRDRIVRRDAAYTWHRADLSEAHARAAIGGTLALRAPSGEFLQFEYDRHVEHQDGNWTWIGRLRGAHAATEAVITFGDKAVFGNIAQRFGEPLRLTIKDGVSWLIETDPRQIALLDNVGTRPTQPDFVVAPELVSDAVQRQQAPSDAPAPAAMASATSASSTVPTVDLLLGYTPGFVSYYGGESQATTRLLNMVEITNESYVNSQINARVRLVRTMLVNYTDSNSNKTALEELTGYRSSSTVPPNPAFAELRNARETYGADLVSLVRRFNTPENEGCGIAWLLGGGRRGAIAASSEYFGYSIVSDGRDAGDDGKNYFCRDETLAHELGHNMGSAHDRDTSDGDDNVLQSNEYGVFDYSFGHKTAAGTGNFYTVMAYGDSGQTRYRVFSNPRITYCGGVACGVENSADNARSIGQTFGAIAAFRPTVVPDTSVRAVRNDLNGDGKSDIVWRNPGLELQAHWLMNGRQRTAESVRAVSSIYRIIGTGDFDGDRVTDLLWTNNTNDLLWIWRSNGTGGYDVQLLSGYPANWRVEGIADLNADGKSDLIWRNPVIGRFDVWLLNGPSIIGTAAQNVSATDRVAGTGDFDGDGRGDILWTDASGLNVSMWRGQGNGQFDKLAVGSVPNGWVVRGVTDLNGDGRSDVVWQNNGLGVVDYWLMNGTAVTGNRSTPVGSIYRVIATGDFDGDGRGDLLWTNDSNDLLWVWRTQADGGFISELVDGYPPGWSVMNGGS